MLIPSTSISLLDTIGQGMCLVITKDLDNDLLLSHDCHDHMKSSNALTVPPSSLLHAGEFGVVYRAYLTRWEDVVSPKMVAVKTLKGIEYKCQ